MARPIAGNHQQVLARHAPVAAPELGADLATRPPVPQRSVLVHALVHLHLQPGRVRGIEGQARLRRAGVQAGALERRQDPRHLVGLGQAVVDRRGIADGDDVVFVDGVAHVVGGEMAVDAIEAVVGIVLP